MDRRTFIASAGAAATTTMLAPGSPFAHAAEWDAQEKEVRPQTMPLTQPSKTSQNSGEMPAVPSRLAMAIANRPASAPVKAALDRISRRVKRGGAVA